MRYSHLFRQWVIPAWLQASRLSARVLVKIDPSGRVVEKAFIKKSGNPQFDSAVESAIERADPFPAPPRTLARMYMEEGFECGFPK